MQVLTAASTDTWLRTATQPLCKKHNKQKGQQPLEDWQEHLEWLTEKFGKKAKKASTNVANDMT